MKNRVSGKALVPPPRVPTQSELIAPSEVIALSEVSGPSDVTELAAADQWLADRSRRREQLIHELETARARRRRRGGVGHV